MNDRISALKSGSNDEIAKLYNDYKSGFFLFLRKYGLSDDELKDIYQDSIIALIENAGKGYLDNLKADVKTYLFSIGKFKVFKQLKRPAELPEIGWYEPEEGLDEERVEKLNFVLPKLSKRCYEILRLFYYEEKKLDEIKLILEYSTKDVLKSQKSRCVQQLKKLYKNYEPIN